VFASEQIADTADVTINNSGLLNLGGLSDQPVTESVNSLTMTGGRVTQGPRGGTLVLAGSSTLSHETFTSDAAEDLAVGFVTSPELRCGSAKPTRRASPRCTECSWIAARRARRRSTFSTVP
jgi:hypothetical protein